MSRRDKGGGGKSGKSSGFQPKFQPKKKKFKQKDRTSERPEERGRSFDRPARPGERSARTGERPARPGERPTQRRDERSGPSSGPRPEGRFGRDRDQRPGQRSGQRADSRPGAGGRDRDQPRGEKSFGPGRDRGDQKSAKPFGPRGQSGKGLDRSSTGGGRSNFRPRPGLAPTRSEARNGPNLSDSRVLTFQGPIQKNAKGFAFLLRKEGDIFIPPNFASEMLSNDVVKVWVDTRRSNELLKAEVVTRGIKSFIGTYESDFGNRKVMLSDRTMNEEVFITENPALPGLRTGHKVLVEITKYKPRTEGKIVRSFGPELAPKHDTFSVVVRSQWPMEFTDEVKQEAETLSRDIQAKATAENYKGRKDLRDKPFVTIDGKDARDFDDAVLVEKTDSGYVLYVAIADVSEFVQPGTKLNAAAYERSTSVYFPEWVIPMLPEALSNGACSLRPDEEKLTVTCEIHYDENAKKRSVKIYESVIKSHRRCIYEDVQVEFDRGDEFWKVPYELYQKIKKVKKQRGSLDLDLPESKIVLDENSDTIDIIKVERKDSHKLIEEFMIAANESVTEVMERERWPFVYRVHEPPKTEALQRFERFALALGVKPGLGEGNDPRLFSKFLDSIKEKPYSMTLSYLILRSLKQARYETLNLRHFGLASRAYTHFTSPIRRYPDLMVHRLLKRYSRHQKFKVEEAGEYAEYLSEACEHCSQRERRAEELDRTVTRVKKARFMHKHYGEDLEAKISNVSETGLFIELKKWFVEGLIPVDELGSDYFEFIEDKLMLKGKKSGIKYKIGDELMVRVLRVDVDNGFVDFTLTETADKEDEDIQNR